MLLGAEINIYTDHRNLTFKNFNTQRVLHWWCLIEEYSRKIEDLRSLESSLRGQLKDMEVNTKASASQVEANLNQKIKELREKEETST